MQITYLYICGGGAAAILYVPSLPPSCAKAKPLKLGLSSKDRDCHEDTDRMALQTAFALLLASSLLSHYSEGEFLRSAFCRDYLTGTDGS